MSDTRREWSQHPDKVRSVQERRRSGGHGLHKDKRSRRARTRSAVIRNELKIWSD